MVRKQLPPGVAALGVLLGIVLVVGILYVAKSFLVPLALAVLLTFVLAPIVRGFEHFHLPRLLAVLLTVTLALGAFVAVGWGVGMQVNRLMQQLPHHKDKIKEKIADLRGTGDGVFGKFLQMIREVTEEPEKLAEAVPKAPENQVVVLRPDEPSSLEKLANAILPALEPVATAGLVLILVVFMLSSREDLRNRFIGLLGHGHLTGTTSVIVDAAERLSGYLLAQLLVNIGFATMFGIALLVLGVPYAFLWGFLTGLLRFVPYIGTWVSVAFPLTLSFALAPNWTQPILVLVIFSAMDLVMANVVEPLLFGHRTGVTPIALLVAAAFWTWVWGTIGLVLSTPMTVCLVVLGQHVPRFRFFALLLGDQPALETHVSYYQRLLSRDVEEAKQIAVAHAKTHGDAVYDEVLLPALVLAQQDLKNEGLSREDEEFINENTLKILTALEETPATVESRDGQASAVPSLERVRGESLILACPARQQAEELPCRMLGLLMRAHGFKVEALSTKTLPSEIEQRVAEEKPAFIFIAVLPPGGFVQVRYLCKRLRKLDAKLTIIVGYWGHQRNFDNLLVRLRAAGASYVTTSLTQAASRILALAGKADVGKGVGNQSDKKGVGARTEG